MSSISRENIPTVGDTVEKVILSTDKKFIQITFSSNKKVVLQLTDSIKPSDTPLAVARKVGNISKPVVKTESAKPVNAMSKNSPEDPDYKRKAAETLARITGQPIEDIIVQQGAVQMESTTMSKEELNDAAQSAIARSEERSRRLAEEISRENGGRLESSFGGKDTISMGG